MTIWCTRRDTIRAIGVGTVAGALLGTASADTHGNTYTGEVIWETDFEVGESPGSPTVVDDVIYVGTEDRTVAINALTSELAWESSSFAGSTEMSPNVTDTAVYITGSRSVWEYSTDGPSDSNLGEQWEVEIDSDNSGSPTVREGVVYFGDEPGNVYAVNTETQEFEWTFEENPYGDVLSPTVVNGTVYAGAGGFAGEADGGAVYALDAETGTEQWSVTFEMEQEPMGVTVDDGVVYAIAGDSGNQVYSVFALDAGTGDVNWSNDTELDSTPAGDITPLTAADGKLYYGVGESVKAISAASGTEEWSHELPEVSSKLMTPTVAGDTVFTGGEGRNVVALDAATGDEKWSTDDFGSLERGFKGIVVAGALFLTADEESLYAINAGVEGSSVDSRVRDGVAGHHHEWPAIAPPDNPYAEPSAPPSDDGDDGDDDNSSDGGDDDGEGTDDSDGDTAEDTSGGSGPGFGVIGGLAGIGGATYAALRILEGSDNQE